MIKLIIFLLLGASGVLFFISGISLKAEPEAVSRAHIIISGEAKELITAARRAEASKDWEQAVRNYQKALESYPNYLVPAEAAGLSAVAPGGYIGVKHFCRNAIRSLPPEGQAVYRKLFNQPAQKYFELAARRDDAVQMEITVDRYFYTTAGMKVLDWLVQYYVEKGNWSEAADCLEKLLTHPETVNPEAVVVQLKIIYERTGGKNKPAGSEMTVNNWPVYGGDNTRTKPMGPAFSDHPPKADGTGKTIPPYAWSFPLPLANFSRAEFFNFQHQEIPPDVNKYLLYWPVVDNGIIYLSSGTGIYALNLFPLEPVAVSSEKNIPDETDLPVPFPSQQTGPAAAADVTTPSARNPAGYELVWKFEDRSLTRRFEDNSGPRLLFEERLIFSPVVHQGLVYVNLIGAINKDEPVLNNLIYAKLPIPNRMLVVFDCLNGRMKWKAGGYPDWPSTGNDGFDFLQKASFPVPPAVEGDIKQSAVVYAPAVYTANPTDLPEHYICCLDAATGKLRWKTFVASGMLETNLFNNPTRESVPSVITVDEQNVYYCSNIGVLAALDKKSGDIKWVRQYQQYQIPPTVDLTSPRLPLTWFNNPLIYIPGGAAKPDCLISTPLDSPFLHALDADNGNELWKWDGTELGNIRYVLGVYNGLLILAGENKLMALNMAKEGKKEWVADFKDDPLIGKGGLTEKEIYVGTARGLYRLNAANGKILSDSLWPPRLYRGPLQADNSLPPAPISSGPAPQTLSGNVIILDGMLITISARELNVFYDGSAIEKWLLTQIREKPDNPFLLQRLGQGYLQAGQYEKAIGYFKKSINHLTGKNISEDDSLLKKRVRNLVFRSYLASAEEIRRNGVDRETQFKAVNCLKEAKEWADDTGSQIEVKIRLAELYKGIQEWSEVVACYQSLLQENPEGVYQGRRLWEFARDGINELMERFDRQVYTELETKAKRDYQSILEAAGVLSTNEFREQVWKLVHLYPNSLAAEEAAFKIMTELYRNKEYDESIKWAGFFAKNFTASARLGEVYILIIENYETQKKYGLARGFLQELAREFPDRVITADGQSLTVADYVSRKLGVPVYQKSSSEILSYPQMDLPVEEKWSFTAPDSQRFRFGLLFSEFNRKALYSPYFFMLGEDNIRALSLDKGAEVWQQRLENYPAGKIILSDAGLNGTAGPGEKKSQPVLVLTVGNKILALTPASGQTLWQYQPVQADFQIIGACLSGEQLIVQLKSRMLPEQLTLVSLDVNKGNVLWESQLSGYWNEFKGYVTEEVIVIPTLQNGVAILNLNTGGLLRIIKPKTIINGSSLIGPNQLCVSTSENKIESYDIFTGRLLWEFRTDDTILPETFRATGKEFVFLTARIAPEFWYELVVLDATNGQPVWPPEQQKLGIINDRVFSHQIMIDGENIYLPARPDGNQNRLNITAYEIKTGRVKWFYSLDESLPAAFPFLFFSRGNFWLACSTFEHSQYGSVLYALDKNSGALVQKIDGKFKSKTPPEFFSVNLMNNRIFIMQDNNVAGYQSR